MTSPKIACCPFCAYKCHPENDKHGGRFIACGDCLYCSPLYATDAEAFAAHNKVAVAARLFPRACEALREIAERGCDWYGDSSFTPDGTCLETDPEGVDAPVCEPCVAQAALDALLASPGATTEAEQARGGECEHGDFGNMAFQLTPDQAYGVCGKCREIVPVKEAPSEGGAR